jgi:hypothetical protein
MGIGFGDRFRFSQGVSGAFEGGLLLAEEVL